ncbi:hypothetical protein MT418_005136 [Batrachochytrium dendrobatidis]
MSSHSTIKPNTKNLASTKLNSVSKASNLEQSQSDVDNRSMNTMSEKADQWRGEFSNKLGRPLLSGTFLTANLESDRNKDTDNESDLSNLDPLQEARIDSSIAETNVDLESSSTAGEYHFTRRFKYGQIAPNSRSSIIALPKPRSQSLQTTQEFPSVNIEPIIGGVVQRLSSGKNANSQPSVESFTHIDLAELLDGVLDKLQIKLAHPTEPADKNEGQVSPSIVAGSQSDTKNPEKETNRPQSFTFISLTENLEPQRVQPNDTVNYGLEIKTKIQAQVITELGRRLDRLQKHNNDLIHNNNNLTRENQIAVQTRKDLIKLLDKANEQLSDYKKLAINEDTKTSADSSFQNMNEPNQSDMPIQRSSTTERKLRPGRVNRERQIEAVEREFFDHDAIVESALAELKVMSSKVTHTNNLDVAIKPNADNHNCLSQSNNQPTPPNAEKNDEKDSSSFYARLDKETIQYMANLLSVGKMHGAPTTLGVGLEKKIDKKKLTKVNPYTDVRKGKPSTLTTTEYHPKELNDLVRKASKHVESLTFMMNTHTNELVEASARESYIKKLQNQMNEITASLCACIDVLAEEQRHARHWRSQCQIIAKRFESIRMLFDHEHMERTKFYNKQQLSVNGILPMARPNTTNLAWTLNDDQWRFQQTRSSGTEFDNRELFARIATAAATSKSYTNESTQSTDWRNGYVKGNNISNLQNFENSIHPTAGESSALHSRSYRIWSANNTARETNAEVADDDVLSGAFDERSLPPLYSKENNLSCTKKPSTTRVAIFIPSPGGNPKSGCSQASSLAPSRNHMPKPSAKTFKNISFHDAKRRLEHLKLV